MKLTETTINYLKSQLKEIDTFNRYAPTIVIRNGADATQTNHISLNSETATLLIIWLATRFELEQILHDVAYQIVYQEEDNECVGENWSNTQRSNRFHELTELFKSKEEWEQYFTWEESRIAKSNSHDCDDCNGCQECESI